MGSKRKNEWTQEDLLEVTNVVKNTSWLPFIVLGLLCIGILWMNSDKEHSVNVREIGQQKELEATAVLLSYHRKSNLRRIIDGLYRSGLFAEVIVWNNDVWNEIPPEFVASPNERELKVRVVNSDENIGTLGRYIACSMATTNVCYVQDDDWNTEAYIQSLYFAFVQNPDFVHAASNVFGLTYTTPHMAIENEELGLHASMSWIGCGAFFKKDDAVRHVELARAFLTPDIVSYDAEEWEHISHPETPLFHCDVAFTLFKNAVPVVLGQKIRNLADVSEPISDGKQATNYLVKLYQKAAQRMAADLQANPASPFRNDKGVAKENAAVSACENRLCLFLLRVHGSFAQENGTNYEYANAVDNDKSTRFVSSEAVQEGDFFGIKWHSPKQRTTVFFEHSIEAQQAMRIELSNDTATWKQVELCKTKCFPLRSMNVCVYEPQEQYHAIRFVQGDGPSFVVRVNEIE